jgi:DNA-binding NarL/FixJ family response regulator
MKLSKMKLSPREGLLILGLLDPDLELKQIAFNIGVKYQSIFYILQNVYKKLGVSSVRGVVLWAVSKKCLMLEGVENK